MRDWKAIAKASGVDLSGQELDRAVAQLAALEDVFRPLTKGLPPDLEPVLEFRAEAQFE